MEKTISMNDIIAFIERAMKENVEMHADIREFCNNFKEYLIEIYNNDEYSLIFKASLDDVDNKVQIIKPHFNAVTIKISEMDIALFKVETLKVQEYSRNKVIEVFNTFFDKEDNRTKNIDELDD